MFLTVRLPNGETQTFDLYSELDDSSAQELQTTLQQLLDAAAAIETFGISLPSVDAENNEHVLALRLKEKDARSIRYNIWLLHQNPDLQKHLTGRQGVENLAKFTSPGFAPALKNNQELHVHVLPTVEALLAHAWRQIMQNTPMPSVLKPKIELDPFRRVSLAEPLLGISLIKENPDDHFTYYTKADMHKSLQDMHRRTSLVRGRASTGEAVIGQPREGAGTHVTNKKNAKKAHANPDDLETFQPTSLNTEELFKKGLLKQAKNFPKPPLPTSSLTDDIPRPPTKPKGRKPS